MTDDVPQSAIGVQLGQRPRRNAAGVTECLGRPAGIAMGSRAIAGEFTADGAGAAPKQPGNGSLANTLLHQQCKGQAIFWL